MQGCSQTTKYIKSPCPKIVTFERKHNKTLYEKEIKLSLQRYDIDFFLIEEEELKMLSSEMQNLKHRLRVYDELLLLYEKQIKEANKMQE